MEAGGGERRDGSYAGVQNETVCAGVRRPWVHPKQLRNWVNQLADDQEQVLNPEQQEEIAQLNHSATLGTRSSTAPGKSCLSDSPGC